MPTLAFPYTHSAGQVIKSAEVNANNQATATLLNTTKLDGDNLQTGGVPTAALADSAVTTAKLADSNVTKAKLASGALFLTPLSKTASYAVTAADDNVLCDCASGAITLTLPAAASNSGKVLHVKKIDSSANRVTVDGNSSETIDGTTTRVIGVQNDTLTIMSDGTNWRVLKAEKIVARYSTAAAQVLSNDEIVDFGTSVEDSASAVTTGTSWKFTAPSDGIYVVQAFLHSGTFTPSAENRYGFDLYKNGTRDSRLSLVTANAAVQQQIGFSGSVIIKLAATDYIDVRAVSSAGDLTLLNNADTNYICISRLS